MKMTFLSLSILWLLACQATTTSTTPETVVEDTIITKPVIDTAIINEPLINEEGMTIATRFATPQGYERVAAKEHSFGHYLRNLPLKIAGTEVRYFNGETKPNYEVYDAVVDLAIGKRDLHQCADAVMRLRAEHLWKQKDYENIHFNFTNGFRVDYTEWMQGKRVVINGNKTYWRQKTSASNTYQSFWKYMELIFSYAGTYSLDKELTPVPIEEIQIGDVFIQGGFPGHAVIVVDMATNLDTGKKVFLLAQSYMPAQEIQIVKNPNNDDLSPWYSVDFGKTLQTPEWYFEKGDLKRF